jgi:hypothetical protein
MGTAHLVTETEQALPRTTRQPLFLPRDTQKIHVRKFFLPPYWYFPEKSLPCNGFYELKKIRKNKW